MRVTLAIADLGAGGAQRVVTTMANDWVARGRTVSILTLDDGAAAPFHALAPAVHRVPLGLAAHSSHLAAAVASNTRRIPRLRRAIRTSRPQVVVSFIDQMNVLVLLATRRMSVPVIVAERIDPGFYQPTRTWRWLRRWTYPLADRIVVQSEGAARFFRPRPSDRIVVIPNPVAARSGESDRGAGRAGARSIVAVGRLTPQKRFDLLLRAFARARHPAPWTLTIVGEGPLRASLERLAGELGVAERVFLPGVVRNVDDYLDRASIFVMSSAFEGFPNALCEAMAAGVAVVSTECSSALREIIRPGDNGLLVPSGDETALASALTGLMRDDEARCRLGARARDVVERFGVRVVMEKWDELLRGLVEEAPG